MTITVRFFGALSVARGGRLFAEFNDSSGNTLDIPTARLLWGRATSAPSAPSDLSHGDNNQLAYCNQVVVVALPGANPIKGRVMLELDHGLMVLKSLAAGDHLYAGLVEAADSSTFLAIAPERLTVRA